MNIVTISQLIGPFILNEFELGTLIVYNYNQLVEDVHQIDLTHTGNMIYEKYKQLPPELKLRVSNADILNNQEIVDLTGDIVLLTRHEQEIANRDEIIKGSFVTFAASIIILISFLIVGFYFYIANGSGGIHHTAFMGGMLDTIKLVFSFIISENQLPPGSP